MRPLPALNFHVQFVQEEEVKAQAERKPIKAPGYGSLQVGLLDRHLNLGDGGFKHVLCVFRKLGK